MSTELTDALQWLEHWIIHEIRHPGERQRAMIALDTVKKFVCHDRPQCCGCLETLKKELNRDRPQRPDTRKSPR